MFIRFDRVHERDGRTDRRTDTVRRHRSCLCIASRGKKRSRRQHNMNATAQHSAGIVFGHVHFLCLFVCL